MICRTAAFLWAGKLSITTISPGLKVGTRHCRRYSVKIALVIAIDDEGRDDPVLPQPSNKGQDLPMSPRHSTDNPAASFGAPAQARHVGRGAGGAGFIDKHQPRRI